jgi:predicted HTH domain antitoxin
MNQEITLELPKELADELGTPAELAAEAKEALVLRLLASARISQGKAAELLGISRRDVLHLMARYNIESGPATVEELHREMEIFQQTADNHAR